MKTTGRLWIFIILSIFSSCIASFTLYLYDNKYTIDNTTQPYVLVDDWKLFPDQLKSTEDTFSGGIPVWIGEYPDYSSFHEDGSPFGMATYYTVFPYHGNDATLSLYLQEPFSAVKIYVNGNLLHSQGFLSPYRQDHTDVLVSFPAQSRNEILIQCRNETHYYSGLYYPPVIGSTSSVISVLAVRFSCYGGAAILCFILALFSFVSGYRSTLYQSSYHRLAQLNCCMAVYALYPFLNTLWSSSSVPYIIEDATMMLILYFALSMVLSFTKGSTSQLCKLWNYSSLAMVAYVIVMPLLLPYIPSFRTLYGTIITVYKILQAVCLIFLSFRLCMRTHSSCNWLLAGSAAYGAFLSISQLLINRYEPLRTLWLEEYGFLILVLFFAFAVLSDIQKIIKENRVYELRMQEEIEKRTAVIGQLMEDYQQNIRYLLHDLKKPVSTAGVYLDMMGNKEHRQDHQKQMEVLKHKFDELQHQLLTLQTYNQASNIPLTMKKTRLDHILYSFIEMYQPDLDMDGIRIQLMMDAGCDVQCDENALLRVLQNLLYNSIEHAHAHPLKIELELTTSRDYAIVYFRDNGNGIAKEIQTHIFDIGFTTKQDETELHGLRLHITAVILKRMGGEITLTSAMHGCEFCIKLPLAH